MWARDTGEAADHVASLTQAWKTLVKESLDDGTSPSARFDLAERTGGSLLQVDHLL
jgi:hypothetical protein